MASKSGEKGKRLEREVKDFLNKTYDTEEFSRTPGSGALMGQSNFQRNIGMEDATKQVLGSDLICPTWFKFSIECKNYADSPNYSTIIKSSDKKLDYWLAETLFDSINLKLSPMLFFRTSRKGTHVAYPSQFFPHIRPKYHTNYDCFTIMGQDDFAQYAEQWKEDNEVNFEAIQTWLQTSPEVTAYLEFMLEQLTKGKADNKKQAKIEAVTFLLNSRNEETIHKP